jgi:hypothetical protein
MKARKPTPRASCPVLALAIEASEIIRAWNAIDARKQEQPLDDMRMDILMDRLDAIQEAASFATATSDDGAAFQVMVAGGIQDVLASSTFDSNSTQADLEKRCGRLISAALAYLMPRAAVPAKLSVCSSYFTGDYGSPADRVSEVIDSTR